MSASVGLAISVRERDRRHDLAGLAVAALDDVQPVPGVLHGPRDLARDTLDRGDLAAGGGRGRRHAGTDGLPVEMHRAGAALGDAASVLGAREPEILAQRPEQGSVRIGGNLDRAAVDRHHRHDATSMPAVYTTVDCATIQ